MKKNFIKTIIFSAISVLSVGCCKNEEVHMVPPKPVHEPLPIELLSESDMAADAKTFAKDDAQTAYFTFSEAVKKFSSIEIDGKKYHLPSESELRGIFPDKDVLSFDSKNVKSGISEEIMINGKRQKYYADYKSAGDGTTYSIRFMGNGDKLRSAYRYRVVRKGNAAALEITCRYIGSEAKLNINNISEKAFWEKDNDWDIVRTVPFSGYKINDKVDGKSSVGYFWTASERNFEKSWSVVALPYSSFLTLSDKTVAYPVRLLLGEAPKPDVKPALEYVAEYNLDIDGRNFADSHECSKSGGFFSFFEARSRFRHWREKGSDEYYHIPTVEELRGIFPDMNKDKAIDFRHQTVRKDINEDIVVHKERFTYKADYKNTGKRLTYALRFKGNGNSQLSAWRYSLRGSFQDGSEDSYLEVACIYLGPDKANLTLDQVSEPKFWEDNKSSIIIRKFSAGGFKLNYNLKVLYKGASVYIWSMSEAPGEYSDEEQGIYKEKLAYYATTGTFGSYIRDVIRPAQCSVRLFSDK